MEILGITTLCKFFENPKPSDKNICITKTLKRIGVVSLDTKHSPKAGEMWLVRVIKDIRRGINNGCLVLDPIKQVSLTNIVKLKKDQFETDENEHTVIIKPKIKDIYWVLPLKIKNTFIGKDTVIVDLVFSDNDT